LTILFGQAGLGKTAILRAGIVPRLRPEGCCQVCVRISYAPDAPVPAEQIKQAILRATGALGTWTHAGISAPNESLWEFLHHRGDCLLDADGKVLIPLLIFDQFEEIFTLAQTDDAGKQRAAAFVAELADLVENRPPQAPEQRIDADDAVAGQFDFVRNEYRVLISLREDYLAHLEGLRNGVPSITQNRMRLARMTGSHASILAEFYARVLKAFAAAAAPPRALATLVNRRLLRIEERLDVRRVELTHDVLCGVVRAAREQSQQRLAAEAAQAQLRSHTC
jgi:hypothetical protein